eukprot:GEZU01011072.1.p1 GENE.GEZU01011072.1~~GEZU01011072.1.p1  ORF type:complete len:164 (-),score=19.08 GEZU01011072.1:94-585(-)
MPQNTLRPVNGRLIKESWAAVSEYSETNIKPLVELSDLFYKRLFEMKPEYKTTIFARVDMAKQGQKFVKLVGVIVGSIDHLEGEEHRVIALGARHMTYGVKVGDYEHVVNALLYALEQKLGSHRWNDEIKQAWTGKKDKAKATSIEGCLVSVTERTTCAADLS